MAASQLYQAVSTNWGAIQWLTHCLLGAQLQVNTASRPELCASSCRYNPPSAESVYDGGTPINEKSETRYTIKRDSEHKKLLGEAGLTLYFGIFPYITYICN